MDCMNGPQARSSRSPSLYDRFSRLSLRSKGVAVLSLPLAALFIALFSIYWVEAQAADADRTIAHAGDIRTELLQLQNLLLDANNSIRGSLAGGPAGLLDDYDRVKLAISQSLARLDLL